MPSLLPLHAGDTVADSAVTTIALDAVNEIIIKPIGCDVYLRLDGEEPKADGSQAEDWFLPAGVPEAMPVGHAVTKLKVIAPTGQSGSLKVIAYRNAQDLQD